MVDQLVIKNAVILVSGGLDSATVLAWARAQSYHFLVAISFDYGQRHRIELDRARALVQQYRVDQHTIIQIPTQVFASSALVNSNQVLEQADQVLPDVIPSSYVPCRNLLFLSYAGAMAETLASQSIYTQKIKDLNQKAEIIIDILVGINAVDFSNYPDCRPDFVQAFERTLQLSSQTVFEKKAKINVLAPLMGLSKSQIIEMGLSLGVDYAQTVSCYQADTHGRACGRCLSCDLRRKGFASLGIEDPAKYQN